MTVDEPLQVSDVTDILQSFLIENNIENAEINCVGGTSVGDGFLGVTNCIEVKDGDKLLLLFVKAAPKNEELRKSLRSEILFTKEIIFYSKVIPAFDNFLEEKIGKSLGITPKCYAINSNTRKEALVFENLKAQGFVMFDKKQLLDEEHTLLVLEGYAKFHAVSFAFKDQYPDRFRVLSEEVKEDTIATFSHFSFENLVDVAIQSLREHGGGKIREADLDRLYAKAKLFELIEESLAYRDKYGVILHGDCWINNMFFKYKENSTAPSDIRFLDFQFVKVNLPVFDLAHFFFCSAITPENLAKVDHFLQHYHDNLSKHIREFGSDPENIYPYEVFKEHWKKYWISGLNISLCLTRLALTETKDLPDTAEKSKQGDFSAEVFDVNLSNTDMYVNRMKDAMSYFIANYTM